MPTVRPALPTTLRPPQTHRPSHRILLVRVGRRTTTHARERLQTRNLTGDKTELWGPFHLAGQRVRARFSRWAITGKTGSSIIVTIIAVTSAGTLSTQLTWSSNSTVITPTRLGAILFHRA